MWIRFYILFFFGLKLLASDFQEVILQDRELLMNSLFKVTLQKTNNTAFTLSHGDYIELKYPRHLESRIYSIHALSNDNLLLTILVSLSPHRPLHPHVSEELYNAPIGVQKCHVKELTTEIWQTLVSNPHAPLVIIAAGLAVTRGAELVRALTSDCSRKIFFIHTTRNGKELSEQNFLESLAFYVHYQTDDNIERIHQGKPAFLEQFIFPDAIYLISGQDRTKRALGSFETEIRAWLMSKAMVPQENIILSTWEKK